MLAEATASPMMVSTGPVEVGAVLQVREVRQRAVQQGLRPFEAGVFRRRPRACRPTDRPRSSGPRYLAGNRAAHINRHGGAGDGQPRPVGQGSRP